MYDSIEKEVFFNLILFDITMGKNIPVKLPKVKLNMSEL